ncbi:soluble calcium-activated nucleotidase 1 [Onthophagus taurus]|uniref:soluble calcium-activated nucleotidase 1 n=1 Tax=Onthophagus taurus TaxID=166361 RepID=UPI0039BE1CBA
MQDTLKDGMGVIRDWRKALRAPLPHRIVNRTLHNQTNFVLWVAMIGLLVLVVFYVFPRKIRTEPKVFGEFYNYTYPLTTPILSNGMYTFRIGIIADLDTKSKSDKEKFTWYSYLKKGYLSYSPNKSIVTVSWDRQNPVRVDTNFALKDRGMELSELVVFNGKLLSFDDRTGMIFEIFQDKATPWVLLLDGDGKSTKGFKSEWATVKDDYLYIGSMGKEWTTASGDFQSYNPQFIKKVSTKGEITHLRWVNEYNKLRESLNIYWPGYMIHESGVWSEIHKSWFFLPRRCSKEKYNETLDEHRGCSVLLIADENFHQIQVINLPNSHPTRGFSSFKFIPTSKDDVIVALRTEELNGNTATYITAFKINGEILLPDQLISDLKYEGFEFI